MKLSSLSGDAALEQSGVWVQFQDCRLLIAPAGTDRHTASMAKHAKKFAPALVRNDTRTQTKIAIESMADAVLLDFEGIDTDDKPLNGKDRAHRVLVLENRILRDFVATESADVTRFQKGVEEADGDSLKSGAGVAAQVG